MGKRTKIKDKEGKDMDLNFRKKGKRWRGEDSKEVFRKGEIAKANQWEWKRGSERERVKWGEGKGKNIDRENEAKTDRLELGRRAAEKLKARHDRQSKR